MTSLFFCQRVSIQQRRRLALSRLHWSRMLQPDHCRTPCTFPTEALEWHVNRDCLLSLEADCFLRLIISKIGSPLGCPSSVSALSSFLAFPCLRASAWAATKAGLMPPLALGLAASLPRLRPPQAQVMAALMLPNLVSHPRVLFLDIEAPSLRPSSSNSHLQREVVPEFLL